MKIEPGEHIRVISWDMDGTLYSSSAFKRCLYRRWLRYCWQPSVWRDIRAIARAQQMMQRVRAAGGEWPGYEPVLRAQAQPCERLWFAAALQATGPRPGIPETLAAFRERGYRQIIVSDYSAAYKLQALGISHYFDAIFAGEDSGIFKPSPRVFSRICVEMNIEPAALLHIGDREDTDGVAASAAGCSVVIVPEGEDVVAAAFPG
ncbi:MAG: HAD family hydrolase [Ketobacteraceae bacterium]|nr:HAD family hydrolase [Ketobacteraceae bacterium]